MGRHLLNQAEAAYAVVNTSWLRSLHHDRHRYLSNQPQPVETERETRLSQHQHLQGQEWQHRMTTRTLMLTSRWRQQLRRPPSLRSWSATLSWRPPSASAGVVPPADSHVGTHKTARTVGDRNAIESRRGRVEHNTPHVQPCLHKLAQTSASFFLSSSSCLSSSSRSLSSYTFAPR